MLILSTILDNNRKGESLISTLFIKRVNNTVFNYKSMLKLQKIQKEPVE